jgi:nucleoside 2-deoxyribosyltransferase
MVKVYLAGGFHSGWQDKVKEANSNHTYFDPRTNKELDWIEKDIEEIKKCDYMIHYAEKDNPGFNCYFEHGLAYTLGKGIIFINEKGPVRYLAMMEYGCESLFHNFEDFLKMWRKGI